MQYCRPRHGRKPVGSMYVPRDQTFSNVKQAVFTIDLLRAAFPKLEIFFDKKATFSNFEEIDALFSRDGFNLRNLESPTSLNDLLPWIFKLVSETEEFFLHFQRPEPMDRKHISFSPYDLLINSLISL